MPRQDCSGACPAAQGWPTSPRGVPLQPGIPWAGPLALRQQPEQRRMAALAAPRCTRVAEVMLRNRNTLSHAEKRDGSDE